MSKHRPLIFHENLEEMTKTNAHYRRVLFTGSRLQLVVMTLHPGEHIPLEVHDDHDQFFKVEKGSGILLVSANEKNAPKVYKLKDGTGVLIPAGVFHEVKNLSKTRPLHLYSLYAPPEHPPRLIQKRMK